MKPYALPAKPGSPIWVECRTPLWLPTESNIVVPDVSSMCHRATTPGSGRTGAVGADEAAALSAMLLAVIVTSTVLPTSVEVGVYVVVVAPAIALQLAPLEPQRCHW